ncbi:TAXI family TRAP transporter solute-binding subunit [Propionivibrio sp.]|uniref:TAXI family TRAP transporter solute-binding subunit n=1 Tax=Propionivibrio sp. TaxID=2212460 RepID=UPI003BF2F324
MHDKTSRKKPSLVRHTRDSVTQELAAWTGLVKGEWKWILTLISGLVVLIAFTRPLPPKEVYLAVGEQGSVFALLGEKFIPYFAQEGIELHLINTKGSASSLAELADKNLKANAALMVGGVVAKGKFPNLLSLGSIEHTPLWLFYRGSVFQGKGLFAYFSSKRIALGVEGSAEEIMINKLLALSGIVPDYRENFLRINNQEAAQKLIGGEIDALCIMDGIDGPTIQRLLSQKDIHIANFAYAPAYVKKLPFLNTVVIPMGSLDLKDNRPEQDIQMLASTVTLLVEDDMHPVIQQIFLLAANKIGNEVDQFFANPEFFPAYIDHAVALSPVAKRFYETGPPPFIDSLPLWFVNYVDRIWFLLVGTVAVIYPLFRLFPSYRLIRSSILISDAYTEIQAIDQKAAQAQTNEELQELINELNALDAQSRESSISSVEMNRLYSMKSALNLIRLQIINRKKERTP